MNDWKEEYNDSYNHLLTIPDKEDYLTIEEAYKKICDKGWQPQGRLSKAVELDYKNQQSELTRKIANATTENEKNGYIKQLHLINLEFMRGFDLSKTTPLRMDEEILGKYGIGFIEFPYDNKHNQPCCKYVFFNKEKVVEPYSVNLAQQKHVSFPSVLKKLGLKEKEIINLAAELNLNSTLFNLIDNTGQFYFDNVAGKIVKINAKNTKQTEPKKENVTEITPKVITTTPTIVNTIVEDTSNLSVDNYSNIEFFSNVTDGSSDIYAVKQIKPFERMAKLKLRAAALGEEIKVDDNTLIKKGLLYPEDDLVVTDKLLEYFENEWKKIAEKHTDEIEAMKYNGFTLFKE